MVRDFKRLEVWKEDRELVRLVYFVGIGFCFILLGFVFLAGFVSSLEKGEGCCFLNNDGVKCGAFTQDECSEGASFAEGVECSKASFCEKGCCFEKETGIFDKNVLKEDCLTSWDSDFNCNLPGANLGCCVLGGNTIFETRGQCEVDSLVRALGDGAVDWRVDVSEVDCILLREDVAKGACVFDGGSCRFDSEAWCLENKGDFFEEKFCTSGELNTTCVRTNQTTCVDGEDGVYFLDSCGNVANVYDSSRAGDDSYWEGLVLGSELCGAGDLDGNSNSSSCGNCDRFSGGVCASALEDGFDVDAGNFYCRDTGCVFEGEVYEDGESWCSYDGAVGAGRDVAGSRHWRYVCSRGIVEVEPCADERKEICVQTDSYEANGSSVDFKTSSCVDNNWAECINLNQNRDKAKKCKDATDCFVKTVLISNDDEAGDFTFDVCVSEYPKGFDWTSERAHEDAKDVCGLMSQKCIMIYVKNWRRDWVCVHNCDCAGATFTNQMNEVCRSLGDCGGYVNIEGAYTDGGYSVSGSGHYPISSSLVKQYISNAEVSKNNIARPDGYNLRGAGTLMEIVHSRGGNYDRWEGDNSKSSLIETGGAGAPSYAALRSFQGLDKDIARYIDPLGYFLFDWFFGDTKEVTVKFNCKPWTPPYGGDSCDSCNEDSLKPCSPYRCHSLGATCEFINEGTVEELCIDASADYGTSPVINIFEDAISEEVEVRGVDSSGFSLVGKDDECLDAYFSLEFGVITDKPSYCRFDFELESFENMSYDLGSNLFVFEHNETLSLRDPSHGQSQGLDWTEESSLFVRCRDFNGVESAGDYEIDFCVNEADDVTSPNIKSTVSEGKAIVSFDATSEIFEFLTNELSTCRWDFSDVEYSEMENEMVCEDELGSPSGVSGYLCIGNFSVENSSNDYYIRCADQPWLVEPGVGSSELVAGRNADEESFVFSLRRPSEKIYVEKMAPSGPFEVGTDFASISLKVATAGGGDLHSCYYSFTGYDKMIEMIDTGRSGAHEQPLSLEDGNYKAYFECRDETGDFVRNSTEFDIVKDGSSPSVARVWQEGGFVNLVLNEEGTCRFSFDTCKFSWDDGFLIGTGESLRFAVVRGEGYYVKCQDEFGNVPNSCSVELVAT